jgi:pimeloyl-ACP methyl ester carboxylesterase
MTLEPFEQLPFDAVPSLPSRPHPWWSLDRLEARATFNGAPRKVVYRKAGSGPLLLVHGFMTTGYSWRYAIGSLAERWTVYAPDLIGCGESEKPRGSYSPESMADMIGSFARAVGVEGCAAIGNSMGGYLCMHLALRDPRALSSLVNLHSPGVATARMRALRWALDFVPGWRRALRWAVQRDVHRWVHRNVHYYDERLKSREEHRVYGAPLATEDGFEGFASMLDETLDVRAMARFERALGASGRFPIPLLLVYARRDPMVPPAVGERLAKLLPDARLQWMDEASHFAHVDATERFLPLAESFLRDARVHAGA